MKLRITLITLCFIFLNGALFAQSQRSCTQILQDANTSYSEGSLKFIEEAGFKECFTRADGYSDEERVQARKLVALVHIYEDRIPEAEEAMIELLHDDPEHPIDETLDPYEFVYLYNKFRTKPIFRVGARFGVSYATMNLIDEFGVENTSPDDTLNSSFSQEIGIMFGAYIDYNFWKKFEASLGFNYAQKAVSFENGLYPERFADTGNPLNDFQVYTTTSYKDTYNFLDVPLVIKYNFSISKEEGKLIIFPFIGMTGHMLLNASRSGSREAVTPPSTDLTSLGSDGISSRETLNYSYTGGLGVKLRSNTDYFTLEFGYNKGGNNFVDPDGRYQSDDLVFRLGQVDGNMALDYFTVMFGYQRSIYSPKKLKQYREVEE